MEVVEQVIWGLGNIAGDNCKLRDFVIQYGAVNPISVLLEKSEPGS
jgi:importin subunit alpha-1